MKKSTLLLLLVYLMTSYTPLAAQNEATPSSRLKVGVVLGGGGAKGACISHSDTRFKGSDI